MIVRLGSRSIKPLMWGALWLLSSPGWGDTGLAGSCAGDECPPPFTIGDVPFTDSGNTCNGFTSSVGDYSRECIIGGVDYSGPDAVYQIQLTNENQVRFRVTSPTADFVVVLQAACGEEGRCVASSQDFIGVMQEDIPIARYPPGTYFVYVDSAASAESGERCGPYGLQVTGINPPEPDLSLRMSAEPEPVVAGTDLTYSLSAVNDSPFSATGVRIRAELPAGVQFISGSSGCRENVLGTVICEVGDVPRNEERTRQVTVRVDPSHREPPLELRSFVGGAEPDPQQSNNARRLTTPVTAQADVALTKTDSPSPVFAGAELTYRLRVFNGGPSTATGIEVVDELPADVDVLSVPDGCDQDELGRVQCDIAELAPQESLARLIRVRVDPDLREALDNVATVTAEEHDPRPEDNRAVVQTTVEARVDLTVATTAPPAAIAGEEIRYTVSVENEGPSTATAVRVRGESPAGTRLLELPPECESLRDRGFSCDLGVVAPKRMELEPRELTLTAEIDPSLRGGSVFVVRVANRVAGDLPEPDPDLSSNRSKVRTEVVGEASLSLSKTAVPETVEVPGGESTLVLYQISVTNEGPSDATGVTVTDAFDGGLPPGVVSRSSVGCENDPDGFPECELGAVPVGASAEYVLTVQVTDDAPARFTNTAEANSDEIVEEDTDVATVMVEVVAPPPELELQVEVTDAGLPARLTYTIQAAVPGADPAAIGVDTRASQSLLFRDSEGCSQDPLGFPRCALAEALSDSGLFESTLRFDVALGAQGPFVTEFTVQALDERGAVIAEAMKRVSVPPSPEGGDSWKDSGRAKESPSGAFSLAVPRFFTDLENPDGAGTRYTVRNAGKQPVVVRFEYLDDEGTRWVRLPEIRPLLAGSLRLVDLRDVLFGFAEGSETSGAVRITAFDPTTGEALRDHPLYGDFTLIEPGGRAASGSLLPDVSRSPTVSCTEWNAGFLQDELFRDGTVHLFLLSTNPGTVVEGTIYDAAGDEQRFVKPTISLDSFEIGAQADLGAEDSSGSIGWSFELPGIVLTTHHDGDNFAAGLPAVCLAPRDTGRSLLAPFFEVDSDAATRFSVRNTSSQELGIQLLIFKASGVQVANDIVALPPHATHAVDLENTFPGLVAGDMGFVSIEALGLPTDELNVLAGEYILLDFSIGAAGGGALVNRDRDRVPADLCHRWDQRFFQDSSMTTEALVYVERAFDRAEELDGPVLTGRVFDERGSFVGTVDVIENGRVFRLKAGGPELSLELPLGLTSGTIEWRFRNDKIGHIAYILKSGETSVLIPAVCRDLGPPD